MLTDRASSEDFVSLADKAWLAAETKTDFEIDEATMFAIVHLVELPGNGQIDIARLDYPQDGLLLQKIVWHRNNTCRGFVSKTTKPLTPSLRRIAHLLYSA